MKHSSAGRRQQIAAARRLITEIDDIVDARIEFLRLFA